MSVDGSHRSRNSKTRRFSAGGGACGACGARAGLVYRLPVGSSKKAQQKSSRALRKRRDGAPSRSVGVDERVLEVGWLFEVRFYYRAKDVKKRTWRGGAVKHGRGEVEVQTRTLLGRICTGTGTKNPAEVSKGGPEGATPALWCPGWAAAAGRTPLAPSGIRSCPAHVPSEAPPAG